MDYIIFDLEFNQALYNNRPKLKKLCPFEIIQIGAVKLDKNQNYLSSFNSLIKPRLYKKLHPFVKDMTNITSDQLLKARPFKDVYKDFLNFIGEDSILCVWGTGDIKELFRNIKFHKLSLNEITHNYINIQKYASKYLKAPKGNSIGLRTAVEMLGITLNKDFHDAYNDAFYTSEIFKKIFRNDFKIETYTLTRNKTKSINSKNRKYDTEKLIKQIEKMFNKKLTKEETSMVILSYKMGLTNQFTKKNKIVSHN